MSGYCIQVMYMYYLLSHKMVCRPGMSGKVLSRMSRNTFILTLDGDVDFQPSAVQMLLDRMKKDSRVGAACGRIHPIGSGLSCWFITISSQYSVFNVRVRQWEKNAYSSDQSVVNQTSDNYIYREANIGPFWRTDYKAVESQTLLSSPLLCQSSTQVCSQISIFCRSDDMVPEVRVCHESLVAEGCGACDWLCSLQSWMLQHVPGICSHGGQCPS